MSSYDMEQCLFRAAAFQPAQLNPLSTGNAAGLTHTGVRARSPSTTSMVSVTSTSSAPGTAPLPSCQQELRAVGFALNELSRASEHLENATGNKLQQLRDANTKLEQDVVECDRKLGRQLKRNESNSVRDCWRSTEYETMQIRESLQDLRSGRWALTREIRSLGLSLSSHRDFLGTMAHEVELLSEQVSENRDWKSWTKNKMIPAGLRLVSFFLGMVLTGRSIWLGKMKPIVRRYGALGKVIVGVMTAAVLFAIWYVLTFIKWFYIYVALVVLFIYTITA
eukprot:m.256250 g.256250  ORF g.256250 m.256250 type:complete len:280 (-) comp19628_c0_seq10:105-944(-)